MSHRVSVTISDAIYDAMLAQAKHDGQAVMRDQGRGYALRKAVRTWLNQNHYSTTLLDMDDESYAERLRGQAEAVPRPLKSYWPRIGE